MEPRQQIRFMTKAREMRMKAGMSFLEAEMRTIASFCRVPLEQVREAFKQAGQPAREAT